VLALVEDGLKMETGPPAKEVLHIVFNTHMGSNSQSIFAVWKVESISFEAQIFIT